MSFMDYLTMYEKKIEQSSMVRVMEKPIVQKRTIVKEQVEQPKQKVIIKRIIKTVKVPVYIDRATNQIIEEKEIKKQPIKKEVDLTKPISHAANILDEMVEGASFGYYHAPEVPQERTIPKAEAVNVRNRAADILGGDDTSSFTQPMQMNEDMLKYVPKEMLQRDGVRQPQPVRQQQQQQQSQQPNGSVPPELQKMMNEQYKFQNMFNSNVNMDEAMSEAKRMGLV
jgi:hypothetical protein